MNSERRHRNSEHLNSAKKYENMKHFCQIINLNFSIFSFVDAGSTTIFIKVYAYSKIASIIMPSI